MPSKISSKQYEYFQKRRKGFERYNFSFFKAMENSKWHIVDGFTFQGNILEELFNELSQRLYTPNSKVRKKIDS